MSILSIESIYCEDDTVYVTAVVDDMVQVYTQTYYDPPEYGPALCEASFTLDDEVLPEDEKELIELLENYDLEWSLVDCSDY